MPTHSSKEGKNPVIEIIKVIKKNEKRQKEIQDKNPDWYII